MVISMSRRDEQLLEEAIKKAKSQAYDIIVSALIVTLHDKFKFGEVRLRRVMEGIAKECDTLTTGMIGYIDYRAYAEERTGLNLENYYEEL